MMTLNTLISGQVFKNIEYEMLADQFYLSSGSEMWIYSENSGQYNIINNADSIQQILLYYNK